MRTVLRFPTRFRAGHYHLESVELPDDTRLGALFADEREIDPQAVIEVKAGQAVSVRMQLLTLEKQRFSLMRAEIGEDGARQETAVQEEITVDLCAVDGTIVTGDIPLEDGGVTVEALSGEYVLRLAEKDAAGLDVLPQSEPFELPGREETVVFESTQTRLMLRSVDENRQRDCGRGLYRDRFERTQLFRDDG